MSVSADLAACLAGPVLEVAPTLLGSIVRCGEVAVRITEVEAYAGADDPGSHSYRGRTQRNTAMFGPPGHLYVYFTYGMHHCANVVCGGEGIPSGVLLRGGEVVEGIDTARVRRPGAADRELARGPARLCKALAIDLADYGNNLATGRITLELGDVPDPENISRGPRVGLRAAAEAPWRFWLIGERSVSPYRPASVGKRPSSR